MPSPAERSRNNVRAGVFMTVTLAIGVVIIVVLSGAWSSFFERRTRYVVSFDAVNGVKDLKSGSNVKIGGVLLGRVLDVRPEIIPGEPFERILVELEIRSEIRLYADATIGVTAALLGNDAWIDIPAVGTPAEAAPADGIIIGTSAPGMLSTFVGPNNAAATSEIIENVAIFSNFLPEVPSEYETRIVPLIDEAGVMVGDAATTVAAVRGDYERWRKSVDDVMARVNSASTRLDHVLEQADEAVIANRPKVEAFIDDARAVGADARAIASRAREETMTKVTQLLDRGKEGVDSFAAVLEEVQLQLDEELPSIKESIANARLASGQLKLTLAEVRRSPWKVLYRPSARELEHELLYEAARSFAVAASDLKAASATMDRVVTRHGDRLGEDRASFERISATLMQSFERYAAAQEQLLDVLVDEGGR